MDKKGSNWILYAAIAGGSLLVIAIGVFVYLKCIKSRERLDIYEEMEEEESGTNKNKIETILTSENNTNLIKSSGSLDVD